MTGTFKDDGRKDLLSYASLLKLDYQSESLAKSIAEEQYCSPLAELYGWADGAYAGEAGKANNLQHASRDHRSGEIAGCVYCRRNILAMHGNTQADGKMPP